eukprot:m51a1_g11145 hypothetical protein (1274) ;mRNA; r:208090-219161
MACPSQPPEEHTRRARTEGSGAEGRAQESLGAAWELRQSVVGHVADAADLCSLALALPCALCAPCFRRLALFCPLAPCTDSSMRGLLTTSPVWLRRLDDPQTSLLPEHARRHSPVVALAAFLAGQATPEALGELARRCPGLGCALAQHRACGLCDAMAAVCRSLCGDPQSLRVLAALPGLQPLDIVVASAKALMAACSAGGDRAALLLRELSRPPLCAFPAAWDTQRDAMYVVCAGGLCRDDLLRDQLRPLEVACTRGDAASVRRLALPPYCMGHKDAMCCLNTMRTCCSVGVLEALAAEPYNISVPLMPMHARQLFQDACRSSTPCGLSDAMVAVCTSPCGDPQSLRVLAALPGLPPEALASASVEALMAACIAVGDRAALLLGELSRSAHAVRALGAPPYNLSRQHALDKDHTSALVATCSSGVFGAAEVLDALACPPYSLGRDDLLAGGLGALREALARGDAAVVRRLSLPPYCMGHSEAMDSLPSGRAGISAEMLDVLASEKYNFSLPVSQGHEATFPLPACRSSCTCRLLRMAQSPYCTGHLRATAADSARTEGSGAEGRAQESLGAAWELRQSVVGHVADAADLCSLALALPCALCAPCFRRLQLFCPLAPCTASPSWPRKRHSSVAALAVHLAGHAAPEALGQLARLCPGLSRELLCPACGLRDAMVAVCTSPCGDPQTLRVLAALPGLPPRTLAAASAHALAAACSSGGDRAALLLRELSRAPLSAHLLGARRLQDALFAACRSGTDEANRASALDVACGSGRSGAAEVLDALACPPYSFCREDLLWGQLRAMERALKRGDAEVVRRLALPPYCMGHAEAVACLRRVDPKCWDVVLAEVLSSEPYNACVQDRLRDGAPLLKDACRCQRAWSLQRLAQPPYCLGHSDAVANSCNALLVACTAGSVEVLDALAQPPYSLTRDDARLWTKTRFYTESPLCEACRLGNADAVRRLAQPPYCFGWDEAREDNCAALREACRNGHVCVVEELSRPPRGNLCLLSACIGGRAAVVLRLAELPYSLDFDADKPESLVESLTAIGPAMSADPKQPLLRPPAMSLCVLLLTAAAVVLAWAAWRLLLRRPDDVCPYWVGFLIDNPLRRRLLGTDALLRRCVSPGMSCADLGCGHGANTIAMALLVGDSGRVRSLDVQQRMLDRTRSRVDASGLGQRVQTVLVGRQGIAEALGGPASLDVALLSCVLHEIPDCRGALSDVYSSLRPGGRMILIEPPVHVPASLLAVEAATAVEVGFRGVERVPAGLFNALLFTKPAL